jgi:hypothetical protein
MPASLAASHSTSTRTRASAAPANRAHPLAHSTRLSSRPARATAGIPAVNRAGRNRAGGAEQVALGLQPRVGSPWELRQWRVSHKRTASRKRPKQRQPIATRKLRAQAVVPRLRRGSARRGVDRNTGQHRAARPNKCPCVFHSSARSAREWSSPISAPSILPAAATRTSPLPSTLRPHLHEFAHAFHAMVDPPPTHC